MRQFFLGLVMLLAMPLVTQAADVEIGVPTVNNGILSQTACVTETEDGTLWYWITSSEAEGAHCYRANSETMPALNDSNPAWQEIQWDSWFDELCESGRYGGPSTDQEAAYLTDSLAYAIRADHSFANAHAYLFWTASVETLQALSVLYGN